MKLVKTEIRKTIPNNSLSLTDLARKRNKILVYRKYGGLGDIINTRMIFKQIKDLNPDFNITYAVPTMYHQVLDDHPYIDQLIDSKNINLSNYGYLVDISQDCGRYESATLPEVDKQRGDIWAEISLGITLDSHECHFKLNENNLNEAKKIIENYNHSPKIVIFPKTASPVKDLPLETLNSLLSIMNSNGYFCCIIHSDKSINYDNQIDNPYFHNLTMKQLIHVTSLFDYAISCDTGGFHLTYALPNQIPTLGIFGWTDGFVIGKYHNKFINIQKHRNNQSLCKIECSPCWNWAMCPYYKGVEKYKTKIPVPCIGEITAEEIYSNFLELIKRYPI